MEYLIKLSPDKIINESATTYRSYYKIPASRRFVMAGQSTKADTNWTVLAPNTLSAITAQDELMIVAHGTPTECGDFTPNQLVMHLFEWGLMDAGRIVFKACSIGRGTYLDDFMTKARKYGMQIGEVKGYRGYAATISSFFGLTTPYEEVANQNSRGIKHGSSRYKVVTNPAAPVRQMAV